jgi:hypothetical protein
MSHYVGQNVLYDSPKGDQAILRWHTAMIPVIQTETVTANPSILILKKSDPLVVNIEELMSFYDMADR